MLNAPAILSDRFTVLVRAVGVVESLTVTATVLVAAAVGVPLITPVVWLILKPGCNPVADQVYGEVPPVACTVAL
jgi:hypothetical protein